MHTISKLHVLETRHLKSNIVWCRTGKTPNPAIFKKQDDLTTLQMTKAESILRERFSSLETRLSTPLLNPMTDVFFI